MFSGSRLISYSQGFVAFVTRAEIRMYFET